MAGIDAARWRRLSAYLDEALAIADADRRAGWLDALAADEPQIAAELRDLLDDHRVLASRRFLEDGPALPGVAAAGQTLGAYTLVSQIGQGGMGTVWLAERSDGRFDRRAAIKFLGIALGDGSEQRFRREAGILARLNHPNIAQLADAGVTATGQAYLVLEYVEGDPIDAYCDRLALDVKSRVRLFLDVLAAVAHAHAHLIVHRDLKPPNIFISRGGTPKLLDFGIARVIDVAADPTLTLQRVLTPEYASPEQVRGLAPATTSDIYSLGGVLYRLLTGRAPHAIEPGAPSLEAAICTAEPTPPRRLDPRVPADLDAVVRKALRKPPDERYQSVEAFAEDLRAFLEHRPVRARSGTVWYATRRFARRYWVPVVATALIVVSLAAGLLVAERERRLADQRFNQLRQLAGNVIRFDTEIRDLPGSTAARQRLVSISLAYLEGLAAETQGDVALMRELAEAYNRIARVQGVPTESNLGQTAAAEASLEKADALLDRVIAARPADRPALARSASIAQDRMILAVTEHRDGDAIARAGDAVARTGRFVAAGPLTASERHDAATLYSNIALAFMNLHRYDEAIRNARRSIALAAGDAPSRAILSVGQSVLASALRYEGRLDEALDAIRQARATLERVDAANPTAHMLNAYGVLLREGQIIGETDGVSLGRPADAVAPLQQAVDLTEGGAERDAHDTVSRVRLGSAARELGNVLRDRDPRRALEIYDLAIRRLQEVKTGNEARRGEARTLAESSYALRALGRAREARQRVDRAAALLTGTRDLPATRVALDAAAATVLRAEGDAQAADGDLARAIATYTGLLSAVDAAKPHVDEDLRNAAALSRLEGALAGLYRRHGDEAAAGKIASRRRAMWAAWERKLPGNPYVARQLAAIDDRRSPIDDR